jgi:hypothetical protein
MNEWREPSKDIVNFTYIVIYYEVLIDDENEKDIGIFSYDGIRGIFRNRNGGESIKYKDILKWFPVPDIK